MQTFEYMVVPAPEAGQNRGPNRSEDLARTLQDEMNRLGAEGWEYQRTDSLPVEEHIGPAGRRTTFQSMLVFRRPRETAAAMPGSVVPFAAAPHSASGAVAAQANPEVSLPDDTVWRTGSGAERSTVGFTQPDPPDPTEEPMPASAGSDLLGVAARLRADRTAPRPPARAEGDQPRAASSRDGFGRASLPLPPLVLGRENAVPEKRERGGLSPTLEERAAALARKMAAE